MQHYEFLKCAILLHQNTYYSTVRLLIVNANLLSNSNYLHTSTVKIHLLRLEYHVPNPLKGYTTITYIYALATQVHFFCKRNLNPIKRSAISKLLKKRLKTFNYNPKHYNTHSFRSEKATDMVKHSATEAQISTFGRWFSNAYKTYIKPRIIYPNIGAH